MKIKTTSVAEVKCPGPFWWEDFPEVSPAGLVARVVGGGGAGGVAVEGRGQAAIPPRGGDSGGRGTGQGRGYPTHTPHLYNTSIITGICTPVDVTYVGPDRTGTGNH